MNLGASMNALRIMLIAAQGSHISRSAVRSQGSFARHPLEGYVCECRCVWMCVRVLACVRVCECVCKRPSL